MISIYPLPVFKSTTDVLTFIIIFKKNTKISRVSRRALVNKLGIRVYALFPI